MTSVDSFFFLSVEAAVASVRNAGTRIIGLGDPIPSDPPQPTPEEPAQVLNLFEQMDLNRARAEFTPSPITNLDGDGLPTSLE